VSFNVRVRVRVRMRVKRKETPLPTLNLICPPSHPQKELCGIYFKMDGDLLKNPNKSQKNKPR
jgi:hypothetical protein